MAEGEVGRSARSSRWRGMSVAALCAGAVVAFGHRIDPFRVTPGTEPQWAWAVGPQRHLQRIDATTGRVDLDMELPSALGVPLAVAGDSAVVLVGGDRGVVAVDAAAAEVLSLRRSGAVTKVAAGGGRGIAASGADAVLWSGGQWSSVSVPDAVVAVAADHEAVWLSTPSTVTRVDRSGRARVVRAKGGVAAVGGGASGVVGVIDGAVVDGHFERTGEVLADSAPPRAVRLSASSGRADARAWLVDGRAMKGSAGVRGAAACTAAPVVAADTTVAVCGDKVGRIADGRFRPVAGLAGSESTTLTATSAGVVVDAVGAASAVVVRPHSVRTVDKRVALRNTKPGMAAPRAAATQKEPGDELVSTATTVPSRPQCPQTADDTFTIRAGTSADLDVVANDNDPNGEPLVVTSVSAADRRVAASLVQPQRLHVVPSSGFEGTVSLRYEVSDGTVIARQLCRTTGRVSLRVVGGDRPIAPTARADEVTVIAGGAPRRAEVTANDDAGGTSPLRVIRVSGGGALGLSWSAGSVEVRAAPGTPAGAVAVNVTVGDGRASATSVLAVQVRAPGGNGAPIAHGDAALADADSAATVDVTANDADPEGGAVRLRRVVNGDARLVAQSGKVAVRPGPAGLLRAQVEVVDGAGQIARSWLLVRVAPRPARPKPPRPENRRSAVTVRPRSSPEAAASDPRPQTTRVEGTTTTTAVLAAPSVEDPIAVPSKPSGGQVATAVARPTPKGATVTSAAPSSTSPAPSTSARTTATTVRPRVRVTTTTAAPITTTTPTTLPPIEPVTGLQVTDRPDATPIVHWDYTASGATSFELVVTPSVASAGTTDATSVDLGAGLSPDTEYRFDVTAVRDGRRSVVTSAVWTSPSRPVVIAGAVSVAGRSLHMQWQATAGATCTAEVRQLEGYSWYLVETQADPECDGIDTVSPTYDTAIGVAVVATRSGISSADGCAHWCPVVQGTADLASGVIRNAAVIADGVPTLRRKTPMITGPAHGTAVDGSNVKVACWMNGDTVAGSYIWYRFDDDTFYPGGGVSLPEGSQTVRRCVTAVAGAGLVGPVGNSTAPRWVWAVVFSALVMLAVMNHRSRRGRYP